MADLEQRGVQTVHSANPDSKVWRGRARSCLKAFHTAQRQAVAGCAPNVNPPACDPQAPH